VPAVPEAPRDATYLDAASGAPLHPVAVAALQAAQADGWADPGRLYGAGRRARLLLDAARESCAESIGARADEVSFTADGTTALHAAVLGTLHANARAGDVLVHSAVEHSAVLHAARFGGRSVSVGVDALGRVDTAAFVAAAAAPGVAGAALQAANHEVGTCQPVAEVAGELGGVPLVVDGTQVLAHAPVPAGWAVLAGDARMWGGPTVGLAVVRTGTRWRSPYPADERAGSRLPGQPDLPSIVAAAASLRAVVAEREAVAVAHRELIDRIRATVPRDVPDVEVLGDPVDRLPHIVTFSCLYVDGEALLLALDRRGFAVSSGSSCTSSTLQPSHVLVAMGALTSGNVRVSLHRDTTAAEIDRFLAELPGIVAAVRAELGRA
jgi:cysteine desulfurase